MSYQTLKVDLENGRVRPRGAETLPAKARALLTIVEETLGSPAASDNEVPLADRLRRFKGIGRGEYTDLSTKSFPTSEF